MIDIFNHRLLYVHTKVVALSTLQEYYIRPFLEGLSRDQRYTFAMHLINNALSNGADLAGVERLLQKSSDGVNKHYFEVAFPYMRLHHLRSGLSQNQLQATLRREPPSVPRGWHSGDPLFVGHYNLYNVNVVEEEERSLMLVPYHYYLPIEARTVARPPDYRQEAITGWLAGFKDYIIQDTPLNGFEIHFGLNFCPGGRQFPYVRFLTPEELQKP